MENTMEDYYKVLQYLRETHVDRQYLCTTDMVEEIKHHTPVEVSEEYCTDHPYTYEILDIQENDTVQVVLTTPRDYVDIDTFEVLFYSETPLTKDNLTMGLSNLHNGAINQMTLTESELTDSSVIPLSGGYYLYQYKIRDTNTKMQKKNRNVSSVHTINLTFNTDIPKLYLTNLVMRVDQFNITLEDLDEQLVMGKYYIMNQLFVEEYSDVPQPLQHLCFKSAGAYSWLIWWENEGKTMDDGTREGRNYATRLFDQIDLFIDKYLEAHPELQPDVIEMDLCGFTRYCDYPLHKCKPYHRRRSL